MPQSYSQTLDYLYQQLPMFQRIGAAAFKKDLTNTVKLCSLLGNPQERFSSVHIAGTNGKGSVAHMLAAVFQEKGLKTGLYTSPHLKDFRERIKINGKPVSKEYIIQFVTQHKKDIEAIQPSFFEITVAMAFDAFAKEQVDIAVIETGMGGRLDSTNVITPLLSVITNIGYDHMQFLGDTLEKIAAEKAGIIKENVPVVVGEYHPETAKVFQAKAKEKNARLYFADKNLQGSNVINHVTQQPGIQLDIYSNNHPLYPALQCDLPGAYQVKNILTAVQAFVLLKNTLGLKKENLYGALKKVKELTHFRGRWEILGKKPLTIVDCAHNTAGWEEALQQLKQIKHRNLHFVLGFVNDKDIDGILKMLPGNARYYFCKPDVPRGLDAEILAEKASEFNLEGKPYNSVNEAVMDAKSSAGEDDLLYIGGSTFVVAEAV